MKRERKLKSRRWTALSRFSLASACGRTLGVQKLRSAHKHVPQMRAPLCVATLLAAAAASTPPPLPTPADLLTAARADAAWLAATRASLHTIPELGYDLPLTSKRVRAVLKATGVKNVATAKGAEHGIVATLGSGEPVFALRADMDALPIQVRKGGGWCFLGAERGMFFSHDDDTSPPHHHPPNPTQEEVDTPSKSRHPGVMHACGHDAHMTMLLGAARLLKQIEPSLPGSVRLLFQPAEEGGAGGKAMVDAGDLDGVAGVAGMHVWPGLPTGVVASRPGTLMAASGCFDAIVTGVGGHGAMPHTTVDPVVAASAIVTALQTLVSREADPTRALVVTVARFNTGPGASNVIPDTVSLAGTLRALTSDEFERARARVKDVGASIAAAHRCPFTIQWEPQPYAPTINDAAAVAMVAGVVGEMGGGVSYADLPEPTMAAEDFGFMAAAVGSASFSFLGMRNESLGSVHSVHTSRFRMDDEALAIGAALHAATAVAGLVRAGGGGGAGHNEL